MFTIGGEGDESLVYSLSTKEGVVEFTFPNIDTDGSWEAKQFDLNKVEQGYELTFSNPSAVYTVYDYPAKSGNPAKMGVRVKTKGKVYDMPANMASRVGSLSNVAKSGYVNVQ